MLPQTVPKAKLVNKDRIHMAKIKNRAEKCRCMCRLKLLEKEKCFELRLLNNEKTKLIGKYCPGIRPTASEISGRSSSTMSMKSFKLKETCQTCDTCLDYQNLHDLLFTNNELDIDKIICLYLLSTHDTRHLSPPVRRKYKMTKENSPLERLIYRSNRKRVRLMEGFLLPLPLYILDFQRSNRGDVLINDGRLATKVLFNEKIAVLLNTVFRALYTCNKQKMAKIMQISTKEDTLLEILYSPKIQDYFKWIRNNPLITSCESFVLKPTLKVKPSKLRFDTKTKTVENFLNEFHQNVLQLPSRKKYDDILDELYNENLLGNIFPDEFKKPFDWAGSVVSFMSRPSGRFGKRGSIGKPSPRFPRYSDSASILDFKRMLSKKISSTNMSKSSMDQKLEDLRNFYPSEGSMTDKSEVAIGEIEVDESLKPSDIEPIKYTLKQIRCEACMMKWKQPLPSPKTPMLTRYSGSDSLQTNDVRRLSAMINRELYHIGSYDRRYSKDNGIPPRLPKTEQKKPPSAINENVQLTPMDLAKIKQEIRDKEAQIKLQEFLNK